ncbi:MAG TPA: hypothetical protein VIL32_17705 [Steroidobacteraceae bacterium]
MAERLRQWGWIVLAVALVLVLVFMVARRPDQENETAAVSPAASEASESTAVRIRVLRLRGEIESFDLMRSGRVLHRSDWSSGEHQLPAETVPRLERELLACGVCTLQPAEPLPAGPSRRRIIVELPDQSLACLTDLPWEKWYEDAAARECLNAIAASLQPLREQCGACTVPDAADASQEDR